VIPKEFVVRPLRQDDQLKKLSLGGEEFTPLKTFLRKHACGYHRCCLARTHVLVEKTDLDKPGRVWGFVTLVASEVDAGDGNVEPEVSWSKKWKVPSIKLARMAIDKDLQRQGWGRSFAQWTLALVSQVARDIGCKVLVTDAKKSAVGFYSKLGFTILDTEANKKSDHPVMFLNLKKLVAELEG
jgi:ribosomal protein S18 acetylase RimI-like enzyme